MAESTEVEALEKISTEVGESQIKITLSSQCIKAQAFLLDKLKKQAERQKEYCSFINNNNFRLQTEIKQAELEIKSLIIAQETIKTGNIELKKEFLLAKEKRIEIAERINNGEKKYEALWLESKERYESIPYVQELLQATGEIQILKDNTVALENQSHVLIKEFKTKKDFFANLDKNRIIELAEYLVNFIPNAIQSIKEKSNAIREIFQEIDNIAKENEAIARKPVDTSPVKQAQSAYDKTKETKTTNDVWLNISTNNDRDMITMPRLQFKNSDFDALNAKLDQIKIMKVEILNSDPSKRLNPIENVTDFCNKTMKDDELSVFFNNRTLNDNKTDKENKSDTYSKRKLINILGDVKLDRKDTYDIVSKVDVEHLKGVNRIGKDMEKCEGSDRRENEIIEEIDLTKPSTDKNTSSILIPPTQFLDLSQEKLFSNSSQQVEVIVHMSMTDPASEKISRSQTLKNSQESINKKRVSFDLPLSIQDVKDITNENEFIQKQIDNNEANETLDSPLNISVVSDESYSKIKDMILKKHNLDLSPQFTYAKNRMLQLNTDEKIITSKFFQPENVELITEPHEDENNVSQMSYNTKDLNIEPISNTGVLESLNEPNKETMEVDHMIISSPKTNPVPKTESAVTGFLFNHGTQGIPDSLNVSISTTGFEDGDTDFPHCIDSSLLLSPKADLPMPMSTDNVDVTSQEVPNFLSGLRKTGLSFFGQSTITESRPDTSGPNQGNNFNFNFGGGEQKSRGGLFNMFR